MRYFLSLLVLIWPGVAAALDDYVCDDLWFTRNLIFDRAGYCFGSPLGQIVFNNADCTTNTPKISANDQAIVSHIREIEAEWDCNLDTSRKSLQLQMLELRRSLDDLPIATGYESGCVGWLGEPLALRSGSSDLAREIGQINRGNYIGWAHEDIGDWSFVTVTDRTGNLLSMGWVSIPGFGTGQMPCEGFAG